MAKNQEAMSALELSVALFLAVAFVFSIVYIGAKNNSLPRMAVNEFGTCEYFLVVENDKEVKKGCSVASKYNRYERFHVLSASAQEEQRRYAAEQEMLRHEAARAEGAR